MSLSLLWKDVVTDTHPRDEALIKASDASPSPGFPDGICQGVTPIGAGLLNGEYVVPGDSQSQSAYMCLDDFHRLTEGCDYCTCQNGTLFGTNRMGLP